MIALQTLGGCSFVNLPWRERHSFPHRSGGETRFLSTSRAGIGSYMHSLDHSYVFLRIRPVTHITIWSVAQQAELWML